MAKSFMEENEGHLRRWCKSLWTHEGPIVAISRKGPRLLELAHREGLVTDANVNRVTSERALAFRLLNAGSSEVITICDDICIFGSTFRRISAVASRIYGTTAVRSIPFAVSRGAAPIPTEEARGFTIEADNCTAFVQAEVGAFSSLHKPYDIEHPILYLRLDTPIGTRWVHHGLTEIASALDMTLFMTAYDGRSDEPSWTLLPSNSSPEPLSSVRKVRLYYDESAGCLALAPMAPTVGSLDDLQRDVGELPSSLSETWSQLRADALEAIPQDSKDTATTRLISTLRDRSLVCWANYLLELHDLLGDLHAVRGGLSRLGFLSEDASFLLKQYDVALLVNNDRASELTSEISKFVNADPVTHSRSTRPKTGYTLKPQLPDPHEISVGDTTETVVTYETARSELLMESNTPIEVLEALFKAQHVAIELPSRTNNTPDVRRLEFGVPFSYLREEINRHLGGSSEESVVNRSLDVLIDCGVIVPRYLYQTIEGRDIWYRSFRVGEGQARMTGHVVKECFDTLTSVLEASEVGEIVTEKFFVLNCDLLEMFADPSLAQARKVSRGFHLYGARPRLQESEGYVWTMDWACGKRVLQRVGHGARREYQLHSNANKYFKADPNESPLEPRRRKEVASIARWVKEALAINDLGLSFLIAITTVESDWALAKALEAEIRGWVSHDQFGLTAVIHALDDYVTDPLKEHELLLIRRSEGLANWVAQAKEKLNLREHFGDKICLANEIWKQVYSDTGSTWQNTIRPSLEARSAKPAHPRGVVEGSYTPILGVMGSLSTLLRNVISEHVTPHEQLDLFTRRRTDSQNRARSVRESLERLTDEIDSLPYLLRIAFDGSYRELKHLELAPNLADLVSQLREPLLGVNDAIDGILGRYTDLAETPSDYLPDGYYVLFWDIRNSTEKDPVGLTQRIVEVNNEISRTFRNVETTPLVEFDSESTNDGGVAVCDSAVPAFEIAKLVAERYQPDALKMGCVMCREGMLLKVPATGKLAGRGFQYCSRVMSFFAEIGQYPERWMGCGGNGSHKAVEAPGTGSFFLITGETYKHVREGEAMVHLEGFEKLPGEYLPRVKGAERVSMYLRQGWA